MIKRCKSVKHPIWLNHICPWSGQCLTQQEAWACKLIFFKCRFSSKMRSCGTATPHPPWWLWSMSHRPSIKAYPEMMVEIYMLRCCWLMADGCWWGRYVDVIWCDMIWYDMIWLIGLRLPASEPKGPSWGPKVPPRFNGLGTITLPLQPGRWKSVSLSQKDCLS